jgi:hypothetical protein
MDIPQLMGSNKQNSAVLLDGLGILVENHRPLQTTPDE